MNKENLNTVEMPAPEAPEKSASPEMRASDGNKERPPPQQRKKSVKKTVLGLFAAGIVVAGGWYGYHWFTVGRYLVSTDDAYVSAYNTTLASKVSGYVADVEVEANALVHKGDVIARIEDGDYRLAVESAKDRIASQQATIKRLEEETAPQQAAIDRAEAQVAAAQAALTRAQLEYDRQRALAKKDFASSQKLEAARAERGHAIAEMQKAKASVVEAKGNLRVIASKQEEAERILDAYGTDLDKAGRDLSFTVIRAPIDGVLGNRAVQVGDYVTPGMRLASIVPLDRVFIDANFKETEITSLKPGQKAEIRVDAIPDRTFVGTVESLAPASGAVFSLLPPDNATGNFTKIVQRLPVRISIAPDILSEHILRPGMSVVVDVNTEKAGGSSPGKDG